MATVLGPAIYSTTTQEGIDINNVFYLDTKSYPEYPAPPFITGELAWGTDGSSWVYCTASITISAGNVVLISAVPGSWSVALAGGATVATAPTGQLLGVVGGSLGSLAISQPTGTQTGSYFWVQRAGNCPNVTVAASTTQLAQLYTTSLSTNAGKVQSTAGGSGTTYQVNGLVISQSTGSTAGPNTGILNYPAAGTSA